MEKIDALIIGAGPAGITSAIYLKRSNIKNIVVFNNSEGSLEGDHIIENLYGFESISGKDLYEKGIKQAERLGISVINENVIHVNYLWDTDEIEVVTTKNKYIGKSLVFATGKKRATLKLEGIKELEGHGISYCATCDGFFYKNKDVAVIGSKDFAFNEYDYLSNIVGNITLLTNGEKIETSRNVINSKIVGICRDFGKIKVDFGDGNNLLVDGIFMALGNASSVDFARQLGINITPTNDILVDQNCKTNFDNIYAAGDCTGGILQISKAEYQGMVAGMELAKYLRGRK